MRKPPMKTPTIPTMRFRAMVASLETFGKPPGHLCKQEYSYGPSAVVDGEQLERTSAFYRGQHFRRNVFERGDTRLDKEVIRSSGCLSAVWPRCFERFSNCVEPRGVALALTS
jgi:hypothetical protein